MTSRVTGAYPLDLTRSRNLAMTVNASDRAAFEALWDDLAPIGRSSSGGYQRYAWTREDHTLREWFTGQCQMLGLDLTEDRAGNQWAWWGNPDAAKGEGIVIGSHLDSVPDGGAFDGPLGVVSSLMAIEALQGKGFQPKKPIAVVNFGDEEGARFGVACAGSRIITGALDADRARSLSDADGITMAEALRNAGRDPNRLGPDSETLARVGTFIELHIEQGKALADMDPATSAVAIGTDIWPHGRFRADVPGCANHAGTTALGDRDDALLKAAGFIQMVREAAGARDESANGGPRTVATVGKLAIEPGGINAIASAVTAWVDARGSEETRVRDLVDQLAHEVDRLGGSWSEESWTPATDFSSDVIAQLQQSLGRHVPLLGTGAGHDAGILANYGIPTAMLFVRNPTGSSHTPTEFAETDDCLAGVTALTTVVEDVAS